MMKKIRAFNKNTKKYSCLYVGHENAMGTSYFNLEVFIKT